MASNENPTDDATLGLSINIGIDEVTDTGVASKTESSIASLIDRVETLGNVASKAEVILTSVSHSLDRISGQGITLDTIRRDGPLPILGSADFVSKDIKKVGNEIVKEFQSMLEGIVTEVGLMGDSFKQTLKPIFVEARQVRRASQQVISFDTESGVDTAESMLQVMGEKEFNRRYIQSPEEKDAQYQAVYNLVVDAQKKRETLRELELTKNKDTRTQLKAFIAHLDDSITKAQVKFGFSDEDLFQIANTDDIKEDAVRALIDSSHGAKGRPPVDLTSTKYLNFTGNSPEEAAQVKTAIATALNNMRSYQGGVRQLRRVEYEVNKMVKRGADPEKLKLAVNEFLTGYNKVAISYNSLDDSVTTLVATNVIPDTANVIKQMQEANDVINGSFNTSLLDFKPAKLAPLPAQPIPLENISRAEATKIVKANPRRYEDRTKEVRQGQVLAGKQNVVALDIETAPDGTITHMSLLGKDTNEVITHKEQPDNFSDWHIENTAHEALNYTEAFAKSRGATTVNKARYSEALLYVVEKLGTEFSQQKVQAHGASDLEIIKQELMRLLGNNLAPDLNSRLSAAINTVQEIQKPENKRFVDSLELLEKFLGNIQPGYFRQTVKSKGLDVIRPLLTKLIPGVMKLVPHIPVDDNVIMLALSELMSGFNAELRAYVSPATLHGKPENRQLSSEFSSYLDNILNSPVYEFSKLQQKLKSLPIDNIVQRLPLEKRMRELQVQYSDVRTLTQETYEKVLSSIGFIESGFRPHDALLNLETRPVISDVERASRSNIAVDQALERVASSIAAPQARKASLTTVRNNMDTALLEKLVMSFPKKGDEAYTGTETADLLKKLFSEELFKKDADGGISAVPASVIKTYLIKHFIEYSGSSNFSAIKLSEAAYINNLNKRLSEPNYKEPTAAHIIPAKQDKLGDLESETLLHAAEVEPFIEYAQSTGKIFKSYEAVVAAFREYVTANPKLFPLHLSARGEAGEVSGNLILSNLLSGYVLGGKLSSVFGSKALSGGFGARYSGITKEGSEIPMLMARPDNIFLDMLKNGIISVLDVKNWKNALSASEVANSEKTRPQMVFYSGFGLPTGIALSNDTNIMEVGLHTVTADIDAAILKYLQQIGKTFGAEIVSYKTKIYGDLEGTLQRALNMYAKETSQPPLIAHEVLARSRQYGVNVPETGFAIETSEIAHGVAEQAFVKSNAFSRVEALLSETNLARLLGAAAAQSGPLQGAKIDRPGFEAINNLTSRLKALSPDITHYDVASGILGQLGSEIPKSDRLSITMPTFIEKLSRIIDHVNNLAIANPESLKTHLSQQAAGLGNLVAEDNVAKITARLKSDRAQLEIDRAIESGLEISTEDSSKKGLPLITGGGGGGNIPPTGGGTGGGGGDEEEEKPKKPLSRDELLAAFPDTAKEYRIAASNIAIDEELSGKSLDSVRAKAKAANDELSRLITLVSATSNATFLDDSQKDLLAFSIATREVTFSLEAMKRANSAVARGSIDIKSVDRSLEGLKAELERLQRLRNDGDILSKAQTERLGILPDYIDEAKRRKGSLEEKIRLAKADAEALKRTIIPPEGVTEKQFQSNIIRQAESLANIATARQRVELYNSNLDDLYKSIGPVKSAAHGLLQEDSTTAFGVGKQTSVQTIQSHEALIQQLTKEYASLDVNVETYGTAAHKAFAQNSDDVKRDIELLKLLGTEQKDLQAKRDTETKKLDSPGMQSDQKELTKKAILELDKAMDDNQSLTKAAMDRVNASFKDLSTKAMEAKRGLVDAFKADHLSNTTKRLQEIGKELENIQAKSDAGLLTHPDKLQRAKLRYEEAKLNSDESGIQSTLADLLGQENATRPYLNSRASGLELVAVRERMKQQFGYTPDTNFQNLLNDYSGILGRSRLMPGTRSYAAEQTDTVEQKLKELQRIEKELAEGINSNDKPLVKQLTIDWHGKKAEIDQELGELKKYLDSEFKLSLDPVKRQELYNKTQQDSINPLNRRKQELEADALAGVFSPAKAVELRKVNADLAALTGKKYAQSILDSMQPIKSATTGFTANEWLKTNYNQAAQTGSRSDALQSVASSAIKGFAQIEAKYQAQSESERLINSITQRTANIESLQKQLDTFSNVSNLSKKETNKKKSLELKLIYERDDVKRDIAKLDIALQDETEAELQPAAITARLNASSAAQKKVLESKKKALEAEASAVGFTPESFSALKKVDADLAALTGKRYAQSIIDSLPKLRSPTTATTANEWLKDRFNQFAKPELRSESLEATANAVVGGFAQTEARYQPKAEADRLMGNIAGRTANIDAMQLQLDTYEDLPSLTRKELRKKQSLESKIKFERADNITDIGKLETALQDEKAVDLMPQAVLDRLTKGIETLKKGLEYEQLMLEAEKATGLATAERLQRLQQVNLQLARMGGADLEKAMLATIPEIKSPLSGLRSLQAAQQVATGAGMQDIGINFHVKAADLAKAELDKLIKEFGSLDSVIKGVQVGGLDSTLTAIARNNVEIRTFETELAQVNKLLLEQPTNTHLLDEESRLNKLIADRRILYKQLWDDAKIGLTTLQQQEQQESHLLQLAKEEAAVRLRNAEAEIKSTRALIEQRIDVPSNLTKLHNLEKEAVDLKQSPINMVNKDGSQKTAEELSREENHDLPGVTRGARGFAEQVMNMATWSAEWTIGQALMQSVPQAFMTGISFAKEFEAQMKNVELITQANEVQFQQLTNTIKDLSNTKLFNPKELAEGLVILGQAGFNAAQSISLLPSIAELATATLSSLKVAADITTTAIEAFNVPVERSMELSNTLAAITIESKLELESLGTTFNYIAETASAAGLSVEQTGTAMGIMSNAGVRASTIGTSLRSIIGALMSPTANFSAALGDIGVSLDDVNPRYRDLGEILTMLHDKGFNVQKAFEGLDKRIAGAITSLINNAGEYDSFLTKISGTERASTMAAGQMDTFDAQTKRLHNQALLLGADMFTPALLPAKELTNTMANIFNWLNKLVNLVPEWARGMLGFAATAGIGMAAIKQLGEGFKFIFNAQEAGYGAAAANMAALFKNSRDALQTGPFKGTEGVHKQFLEMLSGAFNKESLMLGAALTVGVTVGYVAVQQLSGKAAVDEAVTKAAESNTKLAELETMDQILSNANEHSMLYSETLDTLARKFGIVSREGLKYALMLSEVAAKQDDLEALRQRAAQPVNIWESATTFDPEAKEQAAKMSADNIMQYLKSKNIYYTGTQTEVDTAIRDLDLANTPEAKRAKRIAEMKREEALTEPGALKKQTEEARAAVLEEARATELREAQTLRLKEFNERVLSTPAGKYNTNVSSSELETLIGKDAVDKLKGNRASVPLDKYAEYLRVKAGKAAMPSKDIREDSLKLSLTEFERFEKYMPSNVDAKAEKRQTEASSKYLYYHSLSTGVPVSGAQIEMVKNMTKAKKEYDETQEKLNKTQDPALVAIYTEKLAEQEKTLQRIVRQAAMLLQIKLPGFADMKGIPRGVIQSLEQFIDMLNAGAAYSMSKGDQLQQQMQNTISLKGVFASDLPELGQQLAAIKTKYAKKFSESALAKRPDKDGAHGSTNDEVYLALHARMEIELQDTVENMAAAGWARIEPKMQKLQSVLQDMLKVRQLNLELGLDIRKTDINVSAIQSTLDYLQEDRPELQQHRYGGMFASEGTGVFYNDTLVKYGNAPRYGATSGEGIVRTTELPGPGSFYVRQDRKETMVKAPDKDYTLYDPEAFNMNYARQGVRMPFVLRGGKDSLKDFIISVRKDQALLAEELNAATASFEMKQGANLEGYLQDAGMHMGLIDRSKMSGKYQFDMFGKFDTEKQRAQKLVGMDALKYLKEPAVYDVGPRADATTPLSAEAISRFTAFGARKVQKEQIEDQYRITRDAKTGLETLTNKPLSGFVQDTEGLWRKQLGGKASDFEELIKLAGTGKVNAADILKQADDLYMQQAAPKAKAVEDANIALRDAAILKSKAAGGDKGAQVAMQFVDVGALETNLDSANRDFEQFNNTVGQKMIDGRKKALDTSLQNQKEYMSKLGSMLQTEAGIQQRFAEQIEGIRQYRAQVTDQAYKTQETFAKATGEWKEPTGQEKLSAASSLYSEASTALSEGKLDEAKRFFSKYQEMMDKIANDSTVSVEDKKNAGRVYSSQVGDFTGDLKTKEAEITRMAVESTQPVQKEIVSIRDKLKQEVTANMQQFTGLNEEDKKKALAARDRLALVEKFSNMSAEDFSKISMDEANKALFGDQMKPDFDKFNEGVGNFTKAVDAFVKRFGEVTAPGDNEGQPKSDKDKVSDIEKKMVFVYEATPNQLFDLTIKQKVAENLNKELGLGG